MFRILPVTERERRSNMDSSKYKFATTAELEKIIEQQEKYIEEALQLIEKQRDELLDMVQEWHSRQIQDMRY
jgi:hypothetical protein